MKIPVVIERPSGSLKEDALTLFGIAVESWKRDQPLQFTDGTFLTPSELDKILNSIAVVMHPSYTVRPYMGLSYALAQDALQYTLRHKGSVEKKFYVPRGVVLERRQDYIRYLPKILITSPDDQPKRMAGEDQIQRWIIPPVWPAKYAQEEFDRQYIANSRYLNELVKLHEPRALSPHQKRIYDKEKALILNYKSAGWNSILAGEERERRSYVSRARLDREVQMLNRFNARKLESLRQEDSTEDWERELELTRRLNLENEDEDDWTQEQLFDLERVTYEDPPTQI